MHLSGCRACCNVMLWVFYGVCPETPVELAICYSSLSLDYVSRLFHQIVKCCLIGLVPYHFVQSNVRVCSDDIAIQHT